MPDTNYLAAALADFAAANPLWRAELALARRRLRLEDARYRLEMAADAMPDGPQTADNADHARVCLDRLEEEQRATDTAQRLLTDAMAARTAQEVPHV